MDRAWEEAGRVSAASDRHGRWYIKERRVIIPMAIHVADIPSSFRRLTLAGLAISIAALLLMLVRTTTDKKIENFDADPYLQLLFPELRLDPTASTRGALLDLRDGDCFIVVRSGSPSDSFVSLIAEGIERSGWSRTGDGFVRGDQIAVVEGRQAVCVIAVGTKTDLTSQLFYERISTAMNQ